MVNILYIKKQSYKTSEIICRGDTIWVQSITRNATEKCSYKSFRKHWRETMPIMLLIWCFNHESPPDTLSEETQLSKLYQCSPSDKISQKWCFMINLWIQSRENCNKTATVTRHFSKMYLYKIFNETLGRNYISGYKSYQCSDCDKAFSSAALVNKT